MASVNKVILMGNLGADPETRYLPSGDAVTNIRIATSETWKDKNTGDKKEATEWHRVVLFGKLATVAGEYLRKGRPVYIEGRIRTNKWTDKDGQDRYNTEIVATEMKLLGSRDGGETAAMPPDMSNSAPAGASSSQGGAGKPASGAFGDMDDDIPF